MTKCHECQKTIQGSPGEYGLCRGCEDRLATPAAWGRAVWVKRIGRLVLGWGPDSGGLSLVRFTPFAPYLWRVFFWRLCVGWLLKTWKEPRKMSRQERRQIERKLKAGKSVVFSNTPGRKR